MADGCQPSGTVVLADDAAESLDLLSLILKMDGYRVHTAGDGSEALALARREAPDVVVADVQMPAMTGIELCIALKSDPVTRLIPVVLMTGGSAADDRLRGITAGADDFLMKPVDARELQARIGALVRSKRFTDDLDSAESVILSLAQTVEARDPYTGGHCARMAAYASLLGTRLSLSAEEVSALSRGGYLHDVGKIGVPDAILLKAGALTPDEFDIMKRHTVTGEQICGSLRILRLVRPIVRSHHERIDGSGYPDGLAGTNVPLLAQVMGIVDVYDALTTDRPYRAALPSQVAVGELEREVARGLHDPDLVRAFVTLHRSGQLSERTRRHDDWQVVPPAPAS
jgi:putative two-component system response regulator